MKSRDTLGDRMKSYEAVNNARLLPNSPLFIRVDGKAFHTFTKHVEKPYSASVIDAMTYAALKASEQMQGFKLAYVQSDEATFMLTDYDTHESQGWFNYEVNKVVSITASLFTAYFNEYWKQHVADKYKPALFDARAFTVPEEDAPNAFIWRQRDWERNSVQMLARDTYSQKELHGKKVPDLLEMIEAKRGWSWYKLPNQLKYGTFVEEDGKFTHEKETYNTLKARFSKIREEAETQEDKAERESDRDT